MSLPDKCPFCGAGVLVMAGGFECRNGRWVTFDCRTSIHAGQAERRTQSRTCEDAERARLAARVAELEAENKHLTQLLDGYRVHADAHRALLAKYDAEKNGWLDIVGKASHAIDLFAKLEAREKRLTEAARAVYLDSIASDHPWTELETRNMHALRDVLEAKP